MYAVNATKVPAVRPRSSLSTDDNHHYRNKGSSRGRRRHNNTLLTLAAFCVFLSVLCVFLLSTLIFIGKSIANGNYSNRTAGNVTADAHSQMYQLTAAERQHLRLHTKPLLRFTTQGTLSLFGDSDKDSNQNLDDTLFENSLLLPNMNASKVLRQLTYRLPKELRPRHYQLRLQPDLQQKTFNGSVIIRVEVLKPISFIPVHAKNLSVSTEEVRLLPVAAETTPGDLIVFSNSFEDKNHELWVTEFEKPLEVGNYTLRLNFTGSLKDRITGFYESSYLNPLNKSRRWIATSKFEPTYARQAFPCFDEPAMKAQFVITIVRPSGDGYHALSNMNVEEEVDLGNTTEVTFAESVPMSTYLACFIVSDFANKTKVVSGVLPAANDFEMRVFATPAQVNKVDYALETGASITEYYIDYFNVPYPLPKLDMAAIPDFVSGAMEHWGLVTFRETALLYDETISSSSNKQRVATVVAHELAHMWFGNLVTMKWWNDLWLNEGFANYIEYKGVDKVHPDWNMLDQFLISDLHGVLVLDATLASHPIVQTVERPSEITELFDSITYSKGSAIIRMLEHLVGEEKFRSAVTSYLQKFIYSNAETDDFLTEVEAQNFDFDVKHIMRTWTEQMGLPVVHVTRSGNTFTLKQQRFLSNPEDYNATFENSEFNYRWSIPITYFTNNNAEVQRLIFNYNDNQLNIEVPDDVTWIKFNKNQIGYYRVSYDVDNWRELTKTLVETRGVFSESDRAHLINDAFALADAAQHDYSIALNLTTYLESELNYVPWSVGASHLKSIRNLLYYTDLYKDFVDYSRQLLQRPYEVVGWNVGSDHTMNLLRVTILSAAGTFGHEQALQEAATRFTAWLENPSVRPQPDIRSIVYYYGMQTVGNEKVWNQVWELFISEPDAQEKVKLMEALAAIKEPWILQRYILLARNESFVRSQDYFTCLSYISNNPIGQSLVWDYVRENWLDLVERFSINERNLGRLIPSITSRFTTQTKLEEMQSFFDKYPEAGAGTAARKEALATVKYNIEWLEHNKAQVGAWLTERSAQDDNEMETTTITTDIEMKTSSR